MKIEVLGPGCPRCHQTHQTVINACAELGVPADIEYITDVKAIAERGPLPTPAVIIDGTVVCKGRIPTLAEAKAFIQKFNK